MKQLALLLLLVAGLTACGGGGEAEPTATAATTARGLGAMPWAVVSPTAANVVGSIPLVSPTASATAAGASPTVSAPTLTPEERAEAEALLKAASLRPEDMPEGFPLEDESFTTNEELAEIAAMLVEMLGSAGVALEDPYSSGRILGYHANYEVEPPTDPPSFSGTWSFDVTVDLFRESSAAHEYLELARQYLWNPDEMAASQEWEQLQELYEGFGLEFRDLSVSSIAFAEVGDERLALEMKLTMRLPDLDTDFHLVERAVAVRRDRAVGSVTVGAVNSSPSAKQLENLARTLDERMKDALE
jgi:hypothetical protein